MNSSKVRMGELYPVWRMDMPRGIVNAHSVRARWTGETRQPRLGEYFLSGAIVEAYRAYTNISTAFAIAELVTVEVTVTGIVRLS